MSDEPLLQQLAQRLWDERHVVTVLLYKLTVARLLLASDERRFVAEALREVEHAVDLLRAGEAAREEALRELAGAWQVDPDRLTLQRLARTAPDPYRHAFEDHLAAFRQLAAEIEGATRDNRALARSDLSSVTDQLDLLTGIGSGPSLYDAHGNVDPSTPVGGRLREVL